MLRSISIGKRFILVFAIIIATILGTTVAFYYNAETIRELSVTSTKDTMLNGYKQMLSTATHSMAVTLAEAISQETDHGRRVELLRKLTKDVRFGEDNSGYYFIYHKTTAISVPAKPSINGKDVGGAKDVNGVYYVRGMAAAASSGGGFLEFVFPKPGKGEQPKLGYSEMIPGTNYWIGTGVYIDNVKEVETAIVDKISTVIEDNLKLIIGCLAGALLLLVLPLFLAITRSITRPIADATGAAQAIAGGDLNITLNSSGRDEAAQLQKALLAMAATLRGNIEEINERTKEAQEKADAAAKAQTQAETALRKAEYAKAEGLSHAAQALEVVVERVTSAMTQLSGTAEGIRSRTELQQERIQSTATAMTEMNATVLEVAQSSSNAAEMSENAKNKAMDGADVVAQSVQAMEATQHQSELLNENMTQLGEQAQAIGNIMGVITDIADQTNLLALNAAIEAARAGEAGRGFAVVADEVRKLAEKTMTATKEVGDSIQAIQKVAENNLHSMQEAMAELLKASDLSNRSGEVLQEIVSGSDEAAGQIQGIATAAEEQSATSEEINRSIEEINAMTAETAQGVTETTTAIMDITEQMNEIKSIVDDLKEEGRGAAATEQA